MTKLLVYPPNDQAPEAWLSKFDARPSVVPEWPASDKLALVVVADTSDEKYPDDTEAHVLTTPTDLQEVLDPTTCSHQARLFFSVSRALLLQDKICPGLTEACFKKE